MLFLSVLNKHAPIKEKANESAWLTEEIALTQKNRDFYHKKKDCEISNSGAIKQKASFALPTKLSSKMLSTKNETTPFCGCMLKT